MDLGETHKPRGRGRGLSPSSSVTPLRQPRESTTNELASSVEKTASHSNSMSDSNSKPLLRNSTLSPLAPAFVPRNFQPQETEDLPLYQMPSLPEAELQAFIADVTLNPACFESKIHYLTNTFESYVTDAGSLHNIVNTIFEQGICQPNFRYSAARLCNHLASRAVFKNCERNKFVNFLLQRCHEEYLRRNDLASGDDGDAYLRGFVLFIGELFSQIEFPPGERAEQATVLARCIPDMMETLLQSTTKENIKCVVQVLKLTGAKLEGMEKSGGNGTTPNMDSLIRRLKDMALRGDLDDTATLMLKNVVQLRESDWGCFTASPVATSPPSTIDNIDLPIMYGPDGAPLSSEEANFLQSQYEANCCEDPNTESPDEADGMDDEIAAAYEEFLRESGQ